MSSEGNEINWIFSFFWVLQNYHKIFAMFHKKKELHEINLLWKRSWINDDDLQVARNLTLFFLSCAILIFICFPFIHAGIDPKKNNVYFLSQRDSYLTSSLKVFNEEMKLNLSIRLTTVTTRVIALWTVWANSWTDRREWIISVAMFMDSVKVSTSDEVINEDGISRKECEEDKYFPTNCFSGKKGNKC